MYVREKYTELVFTVYYREIYHELYVIGILKKNRNPVIVFMPLEDMRNILSICLYASPL